MPLLAGDVEALAPELPSFGNDVDALVAPAPLPWPFATAKCRSVPALAFCPGVGQFSEHPHSKAAAQRDPSRSMA